MRGPVFLTAAQVKAFHQRGLELYGGSEGLRDRSLFESAVAQAQNVKTNIDFHRITYVL